jgi:hypothetical protein
MNDALKALNRNEEVSILYRGKLKGVLRAPASRNQHKIRMMDHPFFNMAVSTKSVWREVDFLRGVSYRPRREIS